MAFIGLVLFINLATGLGNFGGTFTVVVQGDNATDSPEFVIARGKFHSKMDFSPAVIGGLPLGTVVGKMVLDANGGTVPFTGTFRLPFVLPCLQLPDHTLLCGDASLAALFGSGPLPLTPFPTKFYTDQASNCPSGISSCSRPSIWGTVAARCP